MQRGLEGGKMTKMKREIPKSYPFVRAIKALKGSVRKWEQICDEEIPDEGWSNCPCCQLFNSGDCKTSSGATCPIAIYSGAKDNCGKTPYRAWYISLDRSPPGMYGWLVPGINDRHAKAELEFLKRCLRWLIEEKERRKK